MNQQKAKQIRRARRQIRVRKRVTGTPVCPRLCVYRSLKHMYVQVIDDMAGKTLCAASTKDAALGLKEGTGNTAAAEAVGKAIAEKSKAAGVSKVMFDRNGFRYHGRVKALAAGARKGGLEF